MDHLPQFLQRGGVLLFLPLALFAASCGASTTATEGAADVPSSLAFADEETTTTEAMQMSTVSVAARNSIEASPLWIADSLGLFEKHGIDIVFVPVTDESEVVAALRTKEARAGVLSSTSVIQGLRESNRAQLTPIVYIDGTDVRIESERGSLSLVAPIGSGDLSGCDLEGQRVAVDSERSASAVAVREMVVRDGCEPTLVDFVGLTQDDIMSALRSGDVVGAATLDPLTAKILRGPNELVTNLDHELCPDFGRCPLSLAVFQTEWAEDNPEAVEAFKEAMHEAMTWIRANELDYLAELVNCCSITAEDAAGIKVPNFVGDRRDLSSDLARLQNVVKSQIDRPAPPATLPEDSVDGEPVDGAVAEGDG